MIVTKEKGIRCLKDCRFKEDEHDVKRDLSCEGWDHIKRWGLDLFFYNMSQYFYSGH